MVFRLPDRAQLGRRDLVIVSPAAEISIPVDPRVCCQYRLLVVSNYDGVAGRLEKPHLDVIFRPFELWCNEISLAIASFLGKAILAHQPHVPLIRCSKRVIRGVRLRSLGIKRRGTPSWSSPPTLNRKFRFHSDRGAIKRIAGWPEGERRNDWFVIRPGLGHGRTQPGDIPFAAFRDLHRARDGHLVFCDRDACRNRHAADRPRSTAAPLRAGRTELLGPAPSASAGTDRQVGLSQGTRRRGIGMRILGISAFYHDSAAAL